MDVSPLYSLPHDVLLNYIDQAIEHHDLQDRLHFKKVRNSLFEPNPKQLEFFATGLVAVERALLAANRFGKSLCASIEVSAHLTLYYPDWWNGYRYETPVKAWVAGVDLKSTHESLEKYYIGDYNCPGLIHPSLIVKHDKVRNIYYIRNRLGGVSELTFKSHDQGRESFQAAGVNVIHLDEQYPYDIHSECRTRITKTSPDFHGMIIATFSPIKGTTPLTLHYTQEEISEDEVRNVASGEVHNSIVYINATHDDALHMTQEEKRALLLSYAPHEREARTKGVPSLGSGLVYPISEASFTISPFQIPEHWPKFFGLDFGWHHNTAAVFMAHDRDNDVIYAYGEYAAKQLTPQHHAYQLVKMGANWMPGAYDHAGESSNQIDGSNVVDLYRNAGIKNIVPADKRSVNKGIYTILQRMENGTFKIFSTLTKTLTEIRMYSRDENGKIKKGNDDLLDAMRYGIVSGQPRAAVKPQLMKNWEIPRHGNYGADGWMNNV